ncbi:ESF1 homolog [Ornithorhynchus anatinus]|uniref:ESF1 homolog n=1 Tax=Ornithorhynchus anatinus TaxID=9258 RepID=UPI0010A8CD2D|nr:ESF1 homolog [Ornithorhynchus anatinus]XP_039768932.1 ESF1 homolog [Ornithorhynchus anatinus]
MASKQELMSDQRFSRITKDPRFWEMPEKNRKVKIDKRFQAMFHDKKFKLKYAVDKRGRPINHTSTEDLKRFYDLSDSDSGLSDKESKVLQKEKTKRKTQKPKKQIDSKNLLDNNQKENKSRQIKQSKDPENEDPDNSGRITKAGSLSISKLKKDCREMNAEKDDQETAQKVIKNRKDISANKGIKKQKDNFIAVSPKSKMTSKPSTAEKGKSSQMKYPVEKKRESAHDDAFESQSDDDSFEEDSTEEDSENDNETEEEEESEEEEETEEDGDEASDDDEDESDSGPDLARGRGNVETSSEDEEDDMTNLYPKEAEFEHAWRELDKDAPRAEEITNRLAVCNMDWDRLKAKDLLALFNSFKPKGGVIFSVKIYPSEFGKERMKEEQLQGPVELLSIPEDATDKDWANREKLRDYQFKRLKYFYAVVDCDSPETASKIYEDCDGLEFESSCSFVDLRFIPDDVTFDDEPKDMASEVDITAYKPKYFTSAAMGTSTVEVTWDETDHERITTLNKNFKKDDLLDMDFQAYLASSSEDEEEIEEEQEQGSDDGVGVTQDEKPKSQKDDEEQITKYRKLLQLIQDKEKKYKENEMEMEIKWVPGLKENAEEMVKNKLEGKDKLTPWEQFLEKKKEKRRLKKKQKAVTEEETSEDELPPDVDLNDPYFAEEVGKIAVKRKSKKSQKEEKTPEEEAEIERQKAEMALLMMDDEEDGKKHFNYNKIVEQQNLSKKKKKQLMKKKELLEDDFEVNVADERFQAMYTSHLYNLDPSDPNFKKTKAVEKILEEKARQREQSQQKLTEAIKRKENELQKDSSKKSTDPALSMLIKSIKSKTEQFQARKRQKIK